jgi:hypothetical protein
MAPSATSGETLELPTADAEPTPVPDTEHPSWVADLAELRGGSMAPNKRAAAEHRLEDIRYLRQTGRSRSADIAWRRFVRDFPTFPVAAEDSARPDGEQ